MSNFWRRTPGVIWLASSVFAGFNVYYNVELGQPVSAAVWTIFGAGEVLLGLYYLTRKLPE